MTEPTERDPGTLLPSLHGKLQAFANELTPEEVGRLRTLKPDEVTGLLSPALREKAQRAAEDLSPEEAAHLSLLLRRAGVDTAAGAGADTQGFMRREEIERDTSLDHVGGTGGPGLNAGTILIFGLVAAGALTGAGYGNP